MPLEEDKVFTTLEIQIMKDLELSVAQVCGGKMAYPEKMHHWRNHCYKSFYFQINIKGLNKMNWLFNEYQHSADTLT